MSNWEDYLGTAGDMASGSQNPEEQNDWLDKQQKEQERQRKALERQQQRLMNPGNSFTATPTGLTGETGTTENRLPGLTSTETGQDTGVFPTQPDKTAILNIDFSKKIDDPLGKLPSREVNRQLHDKYSDGHLPRDWAGRPLPAADARSAIEKWQANLHDMSHDMREIHFLMSYENSPAFREKANRAIHELNRVMPALKGQATVPPNADARSPAARPVASSDASGGNRAARTTDPGQRTTSSADVGQIASVNHPVDQSMNPLLEEAIAYVRKRLQNPAGKPAVNKRTGNSEPAVAPVIPPSKAVPPAEPSRPVASSSVAEQIAHIYDPQDQSMTPFYEQARDALEQIMGNTVVGHEDESAMPAYRMAGEAIKNAAENALNSPGKVNAQGTQPPGHQDESYRSLLEVAGKNAQWQTVADALLKTAEAEGTVMNREHGSEFADHFGKGIRYSPEEVETHGLALAAFIGAVVDPFIPGDSTGFEKTKADLMAHKDAEKAQNFIGMSTIFEKGWESLAEKGSDWAAEQMGRKLVFVPVGVVLGAIPSLSAVTGLAMLDVAADLYGEILYRTGQGEPLEAMTFGIPLGLLQRLVPGRAAMPVVKNLKDVVQRLWRIVLQGTVHAAQDEQVENVANRAEEDKNRKNKNK